MPRYFFHIRDSVGLVADTEGMDLPSLAAAVEEAKASATSIAEQRKSMPGRCSIEVHDDAGNVLITVPVFMPS